MHTPKSISSGRCRSTAAAGSATTSTAEPDSWTAEQFTPPSKYTKNAMVVVTPDGQRGVVAVDGDKPLVVLAVARAVAVFPVD
ncbi:MULTISPECIES: hypothetical protein [unclassified Amycolatopsis]|uniref:hypothetical protein n=1 Tax=unclassified Amycolatopsis TaxID=2618356 RepID=UPI001C6A490A|nr:hypothetical protein [Amycolatopsis sp. DSM 110486]QYN21989.1 hypothetical protein K1T34_05630 [Amycolatopsis sp. DSM 110486]